MIGTWKKLISALATKDDAYGALPMQRAKAMPSGIEIIRTIKCRHIHNNKPGAQGKIALIYQLFEVA